MPPSRKLRIFALGVVVAAIGPARSAEAQADPVIARAVGYLKSSTSGGAGEVALGGLALVKAEVPSTDPAMVRVLDVIGRRFSGSAYRPEGGSGIEIYEAGVTLLLLANLDSGSHRSQIDAIARFLASKQNPNGSWDYQGRSSGDMSISQYAVLGLWEAENSGIPISPGIWDRAAGFLIGAQRAGGGWTYHPGESGDDTISMTAAGVGSLLICSRQLQPFRQPVRLANPLLIPLVSEAERARYAVQVTQAKIDQSVRSGLGWITSNFTTTATGVIGHSPFYALYGIERIGALAGLANLGRVNWFDEGRRFIESKQQANGGFNADYGGTPNTAWAVLFLSKSTEKTIRKIQIRRLGAGTLVGGRGLPSDLGSISVAGGHVVARPMDGAIDGMIAVLEDPRVDDASSAFAGLIARYQTEGPRVLRPAADRFRHLLTDPDQGVRKVAAWALARTGDLAMVPILIEALADPDDGVVAEAGAGLQLLARRIEGFGPPRGAKPEQKAEAAARWKAWYESIRPIAGASGAEGESSKDTASPARRVP